MPAVLPFPVGKDIILPPIADFCFLLCRRTLRGTLINPLHEKFLRGGVGEGLFSKRSPPHCLPPSPFPTGEGIKSWTFGGVTLTECLRYTAGRAIDILPFMQYNQNVSIWGRGRASRPETCRKSCLRPPINESVAAAPPNSPFSDDLLTLFFGR